MNRVDWLAYLFLGVLTNAGIAWGANYYVKNTPPTYTSQWALTLPAMASSTNVNLPNIGGAYSQVRSPYEVQQAGDPRENYKFVAMSEPVQRSAAQNLNLPIGEFGKPRIKVVSNSTLMELEIAGETPEEARQKAIAFQKAFDQRLNQLRTQETAQKDAGVNAALKSAQQKLEESQRRLSSYKARTGLVSDEQVTQLSINIEALRKQKAEAIAQQQQVTARLNQLSSDLKLNTTQATDAFALKADQLFEQYRRNYSEATANLNILSNKYGPNHPAVLRERSKQEAALAALNNRSQTVLGKPVTQESLAQINLGDSSTGTSARENLFQQLVTVQSEQRGFSANIQALDQQINQLEQRLNTLAQYSASLDALRRDLQISEAVFSSTLASLDASKSNNFGSYPKLQILTEPSLPLEPTSPNKKLAYLGAGLGCLLIDTALLGWWFRQNQRRKFRLQKAELRELQQSSRFSLNSHHPNSIEPDSKALENPSKIRIQGD